MLAVQRLELPHIRAGCAIDTPRVDAFTFNNLQSSGVATVHGAVVDGTRPTCQASPLQRCSRLTAERLRSGPGRLVIRKVLRHRSSNQRAAGTVEWPHAGTPASAAALREAVSPAE